MQSYTYKKYYKKTILKKNKFNNSRHHIKPFDTKTTILVAGFTNDLFPLFQQ